jgi:hypothetical protein
VLRAELSPGRGVLYATTPDRHAFVQAARTHAPAEGMTSFAALVWDADPRTTRAQPERIRLAGAPRGWVPYDPARGVELVDDPREAVDPLPRPPDFSGLSARLAASVRKLDLALQASKTPFGARQTRELAESVAIGLRALRRVTPSELTPVVAEAQAALNRVLDALN